LRTRYQLYLTILVALVGLMAQPQADAAGAGKVFAIVVGVTNYADRNLMGADANAIKFHNLLKTVFSTNADIKLLLNKRAALTETEKLLEEVPSLPEYSLFIFYFSGHGTLRRYANGRWSDTYLLLSDGAHARDTQPPINGMNLSQVIQRIYRLNRGVAMVFLDCCHSGEQRSPIENPDVILANVKVKAFLLGACARSHETISGTFTDALVEAWTNAPSRGCWTSDDLANQVRAKVPPNLAQIIVPGLSFGFRMNRCIARLNEPSSMVVLNFTNGLPREVVYVAIGNTILTNAPLNPDVDKECYYPLIVEKVPTVISLHRAGNPKPFWSIRAEKAQFDNDVIIYNVSLTDGNRKELCEPASNYTRIANEAEAFGADPSVPYFMAIASLPPGSRERAELLALAEKKSQKHREFFRLASADPRSITNVVPAILQAAQSSNALQVLRGLEGVGAHFPATYLSWAMTHRQSDAEVKSFAAYRYVLNCRVSGFATQIPYFPPPSVKHVELMNAVARVDSTTLVAQKERLPKTFKEWKSLDWQELNRVEQSLGFQASRDIGPAAPP
jgi:hypothetical protein